jgi:SAM-dependent methyltransferase
MNMGAKEHYEQHLAPLYAWIAGDFETGVTRFSALLDLHGIPAGEGRVALDLGAGHGIQSLAIAKHGYTVKAIDFSGELIEALKKNTGHVAVETIHADLRQFADHCAEPPALITCWGDTLTHLESAREVEDLLTRAANVLSPGGYLLLSFRDYTNELKDNARFIPVRSDEKRIFTCMLEYFPMYVKVSDLYQEYVDGAWQMKVSSYLKLRLDPDDICVMLEDNDFDIISDERNGSNIEIVAVKK